MKKLLFLSMLTGFFACSSIKVAFDYDRQVDFATYKTYSFTQDELAATVGDLNRDRIIKSVEDELALKGFTKSDKPDVLVDVFIKSQQKVDVTATTTGGYGPYRYGYGGGFSTTNVDYNEYTEGTMLISIIDKVSEKIVWQGTGTKIIDETASAEKREQSIAYSVTQILKNYPPHAK